MSRTRVREAHVMKFFSHSKGIQECGEVFDEKDSNFPVYPMVKTHGAERTGL